MSKSSMRQATLEEITRMREAGELHHDPNAPEGPDLGEDFWAEAVWVPPRSLPLKSVHLKLEPEVFEFFKSQGKGHLTRMQQVLKAYAEAHRGG
ncbi:hypothetical protein E3C22_02130 [Jiella endophytica]|uniref:3-oxoacyl-ACP synthase n=1 Tax=Jiella endophytica TaxID=2558362 RepID=A0A4Y8RSH9_9HYPH|nr:BrnA antitoxin family protein [Jiella endophytica]TFF27290.1 hypothetical protein E3C22_02130 [Jiella endophytica]